MCLLKDDEETFAVTSDIETAIKEGSFPLPYDLPVTLYDKRGEYPADCLVYSYTPCYKVDSYI
ncbi:hypothetical protein DPMN_097591 [Dreissena polymorpha]|uniref:Uncharacterized protein n=1 Tax=Dreissena polymorpha TaxID=45954 RepID=A0A9D4R5V6_DREPO|nr:hypothetical protein DPMN_097591 [Dreissena polymorpha]